MSCAAGSSCNPSLPLPCVQEFCANPHPNDPDRRHITYDSSLEAFCEDTAVRFVQWGDETRIKTKRNKLKWLEGCNSMLNQKYQQYMIKVAQKPCTGSIGDDWGK